MTKPIIHIETLEDIPGLMANEFAEVISKVGLYFHEGKIRIANTGFVYNIGIDRFSLIQTAQVGETIPISEKLVRVSYDWNGESFVGTVDKDQPFTQGSQKYKNFEILFKLQERKR